MPPSSTRTMTERSGLVANADAFDVETQQSRGCSVFQTSRIFLILFFLGTLGVLAVGAGMGISNYLSNTEVEGTGQGRAISDYEPDVPSAFQRYRFAAVAADAAECSTVGTEVLGEGGSAVDAAIASLLCAGLLNPHSTGIGGGTFMLIYDKSSSLYPGVSALDFRETAPTNATKEFYGDDIAKLSIGPFSIGVPGEIRGYHEAWQRYGRLSWERLFRPAIRMCRRGYMLRGPAADALKSNWDNLKDSESWRELFLNDVGRLYQEHETMTNHRLGDTLQAIADDPEAFYSGGLAKQILADLADAGSHITADDLSSYKPLWKVPVQTDLNSLGFTSYSMPPPSSGAIYNFMLRLIESFGFTPSDIRYQKPAITTYQRIAEIFKFGFAERTYMTDPDFKNMTELLDKWNSRNFLNDVRSRIDDEKTHNVSYYRPSASVTLDGGTSHVSILAPDGSAVSATSTINGNFGSQIRGKSTGIIFNNEMGDFELPGPPDEYGLWPNKDNFVEPGKRPVSSMVPTIMLDQKTGNVRLVIGASGSKRILSGATYVTAHNLWLGSRIDHAVDVPRLHHSLSPNILEHEDGFPKDIVLGLKKKGHVQKEATSSSVCQAIRSYCGPCEEALCRTTCIQATCDRRKEGEPDGY